MLRLTKRIDYGILILTALGFDPNQRKNAAEIAEGFRLSKHMVANILKSLSKAEIVQSGRGPKGGYILSRSPQEISLIEVIEALEGSFALLDCCGDELPATACTTTPAFCTARPTMTRLNDRLRDLLSETKVSDFLPPGFPLSPPDRPETLETPTP